MYISPNKFLLVAVRCNFVFLIYFLFQTNLCLSGDCTVPELQQICSINILNRYTILCFIFVSTILFYRSFILFFLFYFFIFRKKSSTLQFVPYMHSPVWLIKRSLFFPKENPVVMNCNQNLIIGRCWSSLLS